MLGGRCGCKRRKPGVSAESPFRSRAASVGDSGISGTIYNQISKASSLHNFPGQARSVRREPDIAERQIRRGLRFASERRLYTFRPGTAHVAAFS